MKESDDIASQVIGKSRVDKNVACRLEHHILAIDEALEKYQEYPAFVVKSVFNSRKKKK